MRATTNQSAAVLSGRELVRREIDTPVGRMVLGGTEVGVCLCEFVDRRALATEVRQLERETGAAMLDGSNDHVETLARELTEYFAGDRRGFTVPLVLSHGTDFQRAVWARLLEIPYGQTRSYGELAAAMGKPGASRAVGLANGRNRIAIVVPCHRVIESTGGLRGYGGGVWRKKWLLELESRPHTLWKSGQ